MSPLLAAVCGACLVSGLLLVVVGAVPRVPQPTQRRKPSASAWWRAQDARRQRSVLVAVVAGVVAFALTGWVVLLAVVPAVVLGGPALLADPPNRDIEVLEALDRWVRSLSASLPTGKSVADAMRSTAAQAPALLATPVRLMVARLDDGWTQREALLAFADEIDCPEADAVVAALVLSSRRGGTGAATTLRELSNTSQARLRALREIEAERAKPRVVVRQVTTVSLVVLGTAMLTSPTFFAPFRSPIGQVILATLVAAYVACLVMLRRMTLPRRRERILQRPHDAEVAGRGRSRRDDDQPVRGVAHA